MTLRNINEEDYSSIISVLDDWWGGRRMVDKLSRLFFKHFQDTSFIAEEDGTILGFLVGFVSQSNPGMAYIHFTGVHPDHRKSGIGSTLYKKFYETVKKRGCTTVNLITSPENALSIAYHNKMGFTMLPGDTDINGVLVHSDYDGPGKDRVLFSKDI